MANAYWFDHDYNARNDDRILELRAEFGAEGYGVFWMIIETMAENTNGGVKATLIGGLSLGYGVTKDRLIAIIDFCTKMGLFYEEHGVIFSRRLMEHKSKRKTLSDAGLKGAEARWKNSPPIATPMHKRIEESIIQYTTDNKPYIAENKEGMIVVEMIKIFKEYNPSYYFDKDSDYSACLQLAYKIAEVKGYKRSDVISTKEKDVLKSWRKIVEFVRTDDWLKTRSLTDLSSTKEFQRLIQKMNVPKKEEPKKVPVIPVEQMMEKYK
jgi:Domain of unknown function (DUF4373)